MGYTLDQLLDETGVRNLSGDRLTKKAAADDGYKLSKLAERCRRAVDATPDEHAAASQHALVEKTAAVAIIGRTLAEIREIEGTSPEVTKTAAASPQFSQEQFIKTALEAGHGPKEIAEFLEKTSGRIGRAIGAMRASRGHAKSMKKVEGALAGSAKNTRHWEGLARQYQGVPDSQKAAFIAKMRRTMGDAGAAKVLRGTAGHDFKNLGTYKELMKSSPALAEGAALGKGGKPFAASMNIGGSQVGVTADQLKKAKKPAMYAGAGMLGHRMLSSKDEKKSSGRGPVIITG